MPGRHTTAKRPSRAGPILAAVIAVAVIVALGAYLAPRLTAESNASGCDEPQKVAIATPPDLRAAMVRTTAAMDEEGVTDDCLALTVGTVYPDSSVSQINANSNTTPTIWVLDTKARLAELEPDARDHVQVVGSAANTPIVMMASQRASHTPPGSWQAAFDDEIFVFPNPSSSIASAMAIAALTAEGADVDEVLADLAARLAAVDEPIPDLDALLRRARHPFGVRRWFPATEQSFVDLRMRHASWQLTALLPETGTTILDYPVIVRTDADDATGAAARQLTSFLSDTNGRALLGEHGFRAPDGEIVNAGSLSQNMKVLPAPTGLAELTDAWNEAQSAAGVTVPAP
jgi:Bacterial extracellular solute-binding protein